MRIALIGYGAIGREIARRLDSHASGTGIAAVLVRAGSESRGRAERDGFETVITLADLLRSSPDIVVECAGAGPLAEYCLNIIGAGFDLAAASASALVDDRLRDRIDAAGSASGGRLLIASGAIGGLDALSAMRLAGLHKVVYRGVKPPAAWRGTPAETLCDLSRTDGATTFFTGSAREAATLFPKNANVVASVGLAGIGLDRTEVEMVADPSVTQNGHLLEAIGETGSIGFRVSGNVSPDNPKTSMLTAYSLLNTALTRSGAIVLGGK